MAEHEEFELMITIQSLIHFVAYTAVLFYVLYKIKKISYLQLSIIIIIATFFVYLLLLAILDTLGYFAILQQQSQDNFYFISNTLLNRFKWFLLYYFVIEVNSIVLKLKSNDSAAYIEELQHWQLRRRIIYILLIIFQMGIAITRLADKIFIQ